MANGTGAENSGRNTGIEMGAELDASSERGEGGGPGSAPAAALAAALANTAGRSSSPPPSPHLIPPDCDADANADDGPPVANIMQGSSSTSSSLSAQSMDGDGGDGDGDGDGEEDGMDPLLGDAFGGAAAGQGSGLRARGAPGRTFSASTPKRKMSEGSSPQRGGSSSGPGEAAAGRAAAAAAAGDAASSSGTPASSIYSSSRGGTASDSVNWGWFENVHSSTNFLGGVGASSSDQDLGRVPKGGKTKKKKKKGGLLQFSPAVGGQIHVDLRTLHKEQQEQTSMAVTAPQYILEESFYNQKLWKQTAGRRPPQPVEERAYFENIWAQNFKCSEVEYDMPSEVLTATSPVSLNPFAEGGAGGTFDIGNHFTPNPRVGDVVGGGADVKAAEIEAAEATLMHTQFSNQARTIDGKSRGPHKYHQQTVNKPVRGSEAVTVLVKGDNVFGTTVSKSFNRPGDMGVDTISISISSYRVVQSKKRHAQFLVVYRDGSLRETVGVWKRFSDFEQLSNKVTHGHQSCNTQNCASALQAMHPLHISDDVDVEPLPNAITSWKLLRKRQRWFRCLDAGYLSLKVFLLERFLHDILFESTTPKLLREFVGVSISGSSRASLM